MPKIAAPPKWMLFLLWPFKGESCYPQIEGDLSEEFQYQESKYGIAHARRWYCREIFRNLSLLTFRRETIAVMVLPLICVALRDSLSHPFSVGSPQVFLRKYFLAYLCLWLSSAIDMTMRLFIIILLTVLSVSMTGLAFAMVCNTLLRGRERMIRLVFTTYYLSLSAIFVIQHPTVFRRFPADPTLIGLLDAPLIVAFIWYGSIWVERRHSRQATP
jgi:hypothetical protein